jgi:hypothetical protein
MNPKISKIKHIKFNNPSQTSNQNLVQNTLPSKQNNEIYDDYQEHILPKNQTKHQSHVLKNSPDFPDGYDFEEIDFESMEEGQNQFDSDNHPLLNKNESFGKRENKNAYKNKFDTWQEEESPKSQKFPRPNNFQDSQERVLRKTIIFLSGSLLSLSALSVISLNLFSLSSNLILSFIFGILALVLYIIFTNIFFIILVDKLYLWINLASQFLVVIFFHSLIGQLNILTLLVGILATVFSFFAYLDLEKTQLGSRLFAISNITAESTRVLLTLSTVILCLGIFNTIIAKGTENGKFTSAENYFGQTFLKNTFIVDNILIGRQASTPNADGQSTGRNFGLNTAFMGRSPNSLSVSGGVLKKQVDGNSQNATFADFLANNYRPGQALMTPTELEEEQTKCTKEKITNCDERIENVKREKLEEWSKEAYGRLNFDLDTELDIVKFRQVNEQFYRNFIKSLGAETKNISSQNNSQIVPFLPSLSTNLLVPAIFTVIICTLLILLRWPISILITVLSWAIWVILKKSGFVHIEIENVQAETVSI